MFYLGITMTLKLVLMEPFPLYFGHYSTPNKLLSICHNYHVFNKYQIHYCHLKNPRRRKPFLLNINGDKRRLSSITSASTAGEGGGGGGGVPLPPLDLTEDNVRLVMAEARVEASCLFVLDFYHAIRKCKWKKFCGCNCSSHSSLTLLLA